jgi:hypothetical protein
MGCQMSLPALKKALARADFKPHTLTLGSDLSDLGDYLSPMARTVFHMTWMHETRATVAEILSADPLPADAMRFYRSCSDDERMEVLGMAGFYVHEIVHKIDFLTTPFGAGFHGRACLEAIGFQTDGAALVDQLRACAEPGPLRNLPRVSSETFVDSGPAALQARILWFDALRGAPPRYVERGWGGTDTPLLLFNQEHPKLTAHQQLATVAVPGAPGVYLRPSTILESRAVAITALNLFGRLGADREAADQIAKYLRCFYDAGTVSADYRFLLDLYARLRGVEDVSAGIEANGPVWLQQALLMIIVVGWYSLHSPPLVSRQASTIPNPVVRLIHAIRGIEDAIRTQKPWSSGVALMNALDASERGVALELQPVATVIDDCVNYLDTVRSKNLVENSNPYLRAHFDYIFTVQLQQLGARVDSGYNSALGMPDTGSIIDGFAGEADMALLIEEYSPTAEVVRWFQTRENLNFRYARPLGFWDGVEQMMLH